MNSEANSSTPYVLVGMLDSPFVRRVAIVLESYQLPYQNLALKTLDDADKFAAYSPLKRAPTLVLGCGEAVFDSQLIVELLDEAAAPDDHLLPTTGRERLLCRQILGIAAGLADKAISALHEINFHAPEARNQDLLKRQQAQLRDALAWLEERAPRTSFLFGQGLSHADILVATAIRFTHEVHPEMLALAHAPRVAAWCERLEARPEFERTYLKVEPPKL